MIPENQTDTSKETGDCFRACVASLLELPIGRVPNFMLGGPVEDMKSRARKWLVRNFGLSLVCVQMQYEGQFNDDGVQSYTILWAFENTPVIASVQSMRHESTADSHAVVGELYYHNRKKGQLGCRLMHDPNPDSLFKLRQRIYPQQINLLVPLEPERMTKNFYVG